MSEPEPIDEDSKPKGITLRAVITRKDGTVEDLGIISEGTVGFVAKSE